MEYEFTKRDTNIVKGVAILAMVLHHIYPNNPGVSYLLSDDKSVLWICASCGKMCVALLTILSGYGLSQGYKNVCGKGLLFNLKFIISHYVQLLSMYWCVLLWYYIYLFIQGISIIDFYGSIKFIFLDVIGMGMLCKGSIAIGGWYLTAIVTFYIMFPILVYLTKKLKYVMLVICYVPWMYYLIKGNIDMHTDWWLFYVFSFVLGIFLSQNDLLSRIYIYFGNRNGKIFAILCLCFMVYLRINFTLMIDPFLSLAVILLEMFVLCKIHKVGDVLYSCGKHSANIWLLHGSISGMLGGIVFTGYIGRFIFTFSICMGISLFIEETKEIMGYNRIVRKIRTKLML